MSEMCIFFFNTYGVIAWETGDLSFRPMKFPENRLTGNNARRTRPTAHADCYPKQTTCHFRARKLSPENNGYCLRDFAITKRRRSAPLSELKAANSLQRMTGPHQRPSQVQTPPSVNDFFFTARFHSVLFLSRLFPEQLKRSVNCFSTQC